MTSISISDATKQFGQTVAVNQVNLEIAKGEFFTLLGPSGCGKTTLLRCIAGFLELERGQIFFGDRPMGGIPTHKRGVGMVFQNYAVFPHLSVQDNVEYGLKARRVPVGEIKDRTRKAMSQVQLEGFERRFPNQLSGGQLQRVAIARALVIEPEVLLMDEPLSNLDAKLRIEMRAEIRDLQHNFGITTIYVTHDQEEALSISDRIAVMEGGWVRQVGKPWEIYVKPADRFVAGFIGTSNLFAALVVEEAEGCLLARSGDITFAIPRQEGLALGASVQIALRPEAIFIRGRDEPVPENHWPLEGHVARFEYLGSLIKYEVIFSDHVKLLVTSYDADFLKMRQAGEWVKVCYPIERAKIFPEDHQR
jgi:ABC-type Fe3+/spermidine/putrescine transport system ATPase subunit